MNWTVQLKANLKSETWVLTADRLHLPGDLQDQDPILRELPDPGQEVEDLEAEQEVDLDAQALDIIEEGPGPDLQGPAHQDPDQDLIPIPVQQRLEFIFFKFGSLNWALNKHSYK